MKAGYLSQYFSGIAAKYLSAVEADLGSSHQHEFNGVKNLKTIFGVERREIDAKFLYLDDSEDEPACDSGKLTWYDARENHPTRSEHRLYFTTTQVSICAAPGDLLVLGLRPDNSALVIICEKQSTIKNQVEWLFGLSDLTHPGFSVRGELESEQDRIEFASRVILEQIGIEVAIEDENYLDEMLKLFGGTFPSTTAFSSYTRSKLKDIDPRDNPDLALITWMDKEEVLFRTLERYLIADKLSMGFSKDVDSFIKWSLSIINRRKSRAGLALENHMEVIFSEFGILYDRTKITENRSRPDFIFPSIQHYHDIMFNPVNLSMLGVKSTCKDRWRQVLSEANRIDNKHLLTLEAAISENQTDEMTTRNLNLVVPSNLHKSYTEKQRKWLLDIRSFIHLVLERQAIAGLTYSNY